MANYLYNGVELPELPEWDKETYPYAFMRQTTITTLLYVSSAPYHESAFEPGTITPSENCTGKRFALQDGAWNEAGNFAHNSLIDSYSGAPCWANFDVLGLDGSVLLAASEPVPVASDPMPEYMLYNGVKLPNIDKVWTDKTKYPYAFIFYYADLSVYTVYLCADQLTYYPNSGALESVAGSIRYTAYDIDEANEGFILYEEEKSTGGWRLDLSEIIWTSADIVDKRNNSVVHLAGSDPVPVGGDSGDSGDSGGTLSFIKFLASPNFPYLPKNLFGWKLAQKRGG